MTSVRFCHLGSRSSGFRMRSYSSTRSRAPRRASSRRPSCEINFATTVGSAANTLRWTRDVCTSSDQERRVRPRARAVAARSCDDEAGLADLRRRSGRHDAAVPRRARRPRRARDILRARRARARPPRVDPRVRAARPPGRGPRLRSPALHEAEARRAPRSVPAHGALDSLSLISLRVAGYVVALWSLDSCDYEDRDIASLTERCSPHVVSGGEVLLFHEGQEWTLEALPRIVTALHASGMECVTMADLFAK